jgi:hypothetical protein
MTSNLPMPGMRRSPKSGYCPKLPNQCQSAAMGRAKPAKVSLIKSSGRATKTTAPRCTEVLLLWTFDPDSGQRDSNIIPNARVQSEMSWGGAPPALRPFKSCKTFGLVVLESGGVKGGSIDVPNLRYSRDVFE